MGARVGESESDLLSPHSANNHHPLQYLGSLCEHSVRHQTGATHVFRFLLLCGHNFPSKREERHPPMAATAFHSAVIEYTLLDMKQASPPVMLMRPTQKRVWQNGIPKGRWLAMGSSPMGRAPVTRVHPNRMSTRMRIVVGADLMLYELPTKSEHWRFHMACVHSCINLPGEHASTSSLSSSFCRGFR